MTASAEYVEFVLERLAGLGEVSRSVFFGGAALKLGSVQFAMIMGDTLYFRVDDIQRPRYVAAGSEAFSYGTKNGRVEVRSYFSVPSGVFEDDERLLEWASLAVQSAGTRARHGKKATTKTKRSRSR